MGNAAYKILVVEDEPDIRKLVHYNLTQDHYKVLEAESGDQALKLIQRDKPSLVILDLMMPGMSGLEVCRATPWPGRNRQTTDSDADRQGG